LKRPVSVKIQGVPNLKGGALVKPYVEMLNGKNFSMIWNNKDSVKLELYRPGPEESATIKVEKRKACSGEVLNPLISGDIYFRILSKGNYGDKFICRFALNTAFVSKNISILTK
jgi:hypothetical protein